MTLKVVILYIFGLSYIKASNFWKKKWKKIRFENFQVWSHFRHFQLFQAILTVMLCNDGIPCYTSFSLFFYGLQDSAFKIKKYDWKKMPVLSVLKSTFPAFSYPCSSVNFGPCLMPYPMIYFSGHFNDFRFGTKVKLNIWLLYRTRVGRRESS
jgi:hypothetical protein